MLAAKRIALRRREMFPGNQSCLILFVALLLLVGTRSAQAQGVPLPPNEQDAVDRAIDRGVQFLKKSQQKGGTWARTGEKHPIGYALLPALTLLECGVPADDPRIQKTLKYLRVKAPKLDRTYELALGILVLDRIGDPRDKKLIQTFALRLIAGQSMTGGWGYKCPILGSTTQEELLTALRHLKPPPAELARMVGGGQPDMPANARKPGDPLNPGVGRQGGDLGPIANVPGSLPLGGLAGLTDLPSISGGTAGSHSESPSLSGGTAENSSGTPPLTDGGAHSGTEEGLPSSSPLLGPENRWRDCLGVTMFDSIDPWPIEADAQAREDRKAPPAKADARDDKPYVIPKRLRVLTVVQDPELHILQDPRGKSEDLIVTTTDNSNSQFAILALWAAQRYDVPMNRTLLLVIRRYVTSQNIDGSWGYHYSFGGGQWTRPHTMTCVGLIGLAVAHGLAQPGPAGQVVRDPRIIGGLTALYKTVGYPVDHLMPLPMQNLYFLWSIERAAVLYNLPTIGDKDWYRWGAQVLVANQQPKGNWAEGGYPGAHPIPDTCLALLFLKRANLAKDLAARLPFKAADLNDGIMDRRKAAPDPIPTPKVPETSEPAKKTLTAVEPPKQAEPDNLLTKPLNGLDGSGRSGTDSAEMEGTGGKKKWIALCVILFVLLAAGSVAFFFLARRRGDDDEEEKGDKRKKRKNKPKLQSTK